MHFGLIICFIVFTSLLHAQEADSLVYDFDEFLIQVQKNHPISKQARLVAKSGSLEIQKARGAFDPQLESSVKEKTFDDKLYYSQQNHLLRIPTWFGIEAKAGYERNGGVFLNPSDFVPNDGLLYAGVSVPIGQGLFIDKRRAMLKQAKLTATASKLEQQIMVNDLLLEAAETYWKWYASFKNLEVARQAVELAEVRFDAISGRANAGDLPFIDTLEAKIQLQNRTLNLRQAQINVNTSLLNVSTFLWNEENLPLEINNGVKPSMRSNIKTLDLLELEALQLGIKKANPYLNLLYQKQAILEVEKRLKTEALKPKLDLSYMPLSAVNSSNPETQFSINNYEWGLKFSFPLFLRSERASLNQTKIKIEQNNLKQSLKQTEIRNKIKSLWYEAIALEDQLITQNKVVKNYWSLLNGEREKFEIGESSLFLINSREVKYIESNQKLIDLEAKLRIIQSKFQWISANWEI